MSGGKNPWKDPDHHSYHGEKKHRCHVAGACTRCQGKGWIERGADRAPGVLPTRDCPKCGGTGKVFCEVS